MSIINRLSAAVSALRGNVPHAAPLSASIKSSFQDTLNDRNLFGRKIGLEEAATRNNVSWAAIAANASARAVSRQPVYVVRTTENQVTQRVERKRLDLHPLSRLIARPNEFMSRADLLYYLDYSLVLLNEAFVLVDYTNGKPSALWPARPDRFKAVMDQFHYLLGWWYKPIGSNDEVFLETSQVCHIKFGAMTGVRPITPIAQQAQAIDSEKALMVYSQTLAENGGRIDMVLKTESDDPDEISRARDVFVKGVNRSKRNGSGVLALGQGMSLENINLKPADMEFVNIARMSQDAILAALITPRSVLTEAGGAAAQGAAASQARQAWLQDRVDRDLYQIVQALGHHLLKYYPAVKDVSSSLEVFYDSPLITNDMDRARIQALKISTGVMTPNEARAEEGFAPHEGWGDSAVTPNGVPLKSEAEMAELRILAMKKGLEAPSGQSLDASTAQGAVETTTAAETATDNQNRDMMRAFLDSVRRTYGPLVAEEIGTNHEASLRRMNKQRQLIQALVETASEESGLALDAVLRNTIESVLLVNATLPPENTERAIESLLSIKTHD